MKFEVTREPVIDLSDYDYGQDIRNRVLMSQLSKQDVEVLDELLHQSLTFKLEELVEDCDLSLKVVQESLKKFSTVGLCQIEGTKVSVDKEMRKYYEVQIKKFDEDFNPDLSYLFSNLQKVPIHVLPKWYSLPKSAEEIFSSLISSYLETAKKYDRYLTRFRFDDPTLDGIVEDVFSAKDWTIRSKELREKYKLDREEFEKIMLTLEFHFVCVVSYRTVGDQWKEVVTPLYEWHELLYKRERALPRLTKEKVKPNWPSPFHFIERMTTWIRKLGDSSEPKEEERILSRAFALDLCNKRGSVLSLTHTAKDWLEMPEEEKGAFLHRQPLEEELSKNPTLLTERCAGTVEKALRKLPDGWVSLEDVLDSMLLPLSTSEGITLTKSGRKWSFLTKSLTAEERLFVEKFITTRLAEEAIVEIGSLKKGICLRITPHGRMIIA